jgi:parallel beta-helix repeat protein
VAILMLADPRSGTAVVLDPEHASPTTYYVSPSGSDAKSGTSPTQAWQTVARVNRASLNPGDQVLFQGGAAFSDARLTPPTSGVPGRPITFGSFGPGRATITQGAWFVADDLAFDNLGFQNTFYGGSATQGTSNDVTLENCLVSLPPGNSSLGVFGNGHGWVIANNTIQNTGLSGLLLWGGDYRVSGNTITDTGLDRSAPYNAHGIYLDASDSTITGNTITDSQASGISVRYRNSRIDANVISGGQIGIDFFQTDPTAGTGRWTQNKIDHTTTAGIYVSPAGVYATRESFVITGNSINPASGAATSIASPHGFTAMLARNGTG